MLEISKDFLCYAERDLLENTLDIEEVVGINNAIIFLEKRLSSFVKDMKISEELYSYFKKKKNISHIDKLIKYQDPKRKVEIIKYEDEFDYVEMILKFPKGCSKQFKRSFLIKNDLPLKNIKYRLNSPYDCSGIVHSIYVTLDNKTNTYKIEKFYDV